MSGGDGRDTWSPFPSKRYHPQRTLSPIDTSDEAIKGSAQAAAEKAEPHPGPPSVVALKAIERAAHCIRKCLAVSLPTN
jgi:hypothetical protein